jgi:UbiD family decarboxylase
MFSSLSDYVKFLESKGELVRIKEFVDPVLEIAEVTDRVSKMPAEARPSSLKTPVQGIRF